MSMLPWSPIPRRVVPALHRAGANRTCWPDAHPGPRVASSARLHAPPCFCHQRGLVARRLPAICCPPAPARSFLTIPASPVRSGQSAPHGRALGPVASSESPDHGPCSAPLLASCCMAWRRRDSRIPKESHEDSEIAEAPALPWTRAHRCCQRVRCSTREPIRWERGDTHPLPVLRMQIAKDHQRWQLLPAREIAVDEDSKEVSGWVPVTFSLNSRE